MRKARKFYITDKDFEILHFLWKWKLLSTEALAARFYPEAQTYTAYCRLLKLERHRFIQSISFRYQKGAAWMLDVKGFQYILPYLPELSQKGFKSENVLHDFYATAFHLGEWLFRQPNTASLCSEQELRRITLELLPSWVPKSVSHRPDGYSRLHTNEGAHIFAFETELSLKSKSRYEDALSFYDSEPSITGVLWLTGSPNIQRSIERVLQSGNVERKGIHHFVPLSEFRKVGWMSALQGGEFSGRRLIDLLVHGPFTILSRSLHASSCELLLQNSKRPIIPSGSKFCPPRKAPD